MKPEKDDGIINFVGFVCLIIAGLCVAMMVVNNAINAAVGNQ